MNTLEVDLRERAWWFYRSILTGRSWDDSPKLGILPMVLDSHELNFNVDKYEGEIVQEKATGASIANRLSTHVPSAQETSLAFPDNEPIGSPVTASSDSG